MTPPRIHELNNGFRIVTERMPSMKSVAIGLWVNAGGRHETLVENGIAHFLEHMAFKGTARRSALEIAETIEDVGGYINAYTSRESTAFYARCLSPNTELVLDVLADIVLNPIFDPAEIERERQVILQEIGMTLDTPDDIIFDWLHEVSYPDQPFGRSILGPAEKVSGFAAPDLRAFITSHYGPQRMILSAAGDVDHDEIVRQAEEFFGDLRVIPLPEVKPARFIGGERREFKSLEQAHFAFNLEAPGFRDRRVYDAQVWAMLMGGGMSSRLFQKIREERGLCYTIHASAGAYEDTGHITIYAGTSAEKLGELADLTIEEIRRAVDGINEAELARARVQLTAGLVMGLESSTARAERNARLLAVWGRVPDLDEIVSLIEAVDLSAVREMGQSLLTAKAAVTSYGPIERAPEIAAIKEKLSA